ncbi:MULTISPECIES: Ldh family oxidoreductase [Halorussus]|uniref:Ldh family oxidoreductase n=1 Tax=Halorussus TaxID=1070314 RepID=UPI0013B43A3A|nr:MULTISPECIES: Ldh family oxidoreductase [Halorussus]NHN58592.1 Ldh family oxidoreductase [Halorussus sp. JP-T4]
MGGDDSGSTVRIDDGDLRRFVGQVLRESGVADDCADRVAEGLVRADLRGVSSHGVARLEAYVENFEAGGFDPDPDVAITALGDATAVVDADDGPGQVAARAGMETAMELATETGVGAVTVTNSNHFGTAAGYTEFASENDFVGLAMTNVGPDVIPFGGAEPLLGTNPISFSVPTDREFPVTLDMATSVVAMGKIQEVARREDDEIPAEWAVDADGEPTTDPHEAVAVRPLGGPKGYGLGIVVDVFSGLLSGAGPSPSVGPLYDDYDEPMRLGHFLAAVDVETFRDVGAFKRDVGDYVDRLKAVEPRDGFDEVLVPGEIEARKLREQREYGVELRPGAVESLRSLAETYGVPFPEAIS